MPKIKMSPEDLTHAVVLKRKSKKKSGYAIEEQDGEYFISDTPAKARVNVGSKVVRINGIVSDDFENEEDANDLMESIRIVVVPADKIKEYEADPRSHAERLKEINDPVAEKVADGQTFGEDGIPITNPEGMKLTPADMFSPGDVVTVTVGKANVKQNAGLKIEEVNGKYYVRKVTPSGLFAKTPVIAGDKILELNGEDAKSYESVNDIKKVLKEEQRITIVVIRRDADASESSASSVDYDHLAPVIADSDNDTVGYDGHDCGCVWCPECTREESVLADDI